ncbi:DUF5641 domain-containing protein [Trichonephila clavipes]|nr:DUF5641 domain-containing protein [Trichonephila clavipes]
MTRKRHLHVGPQTLLSIVRQRFWPLHGRMEPPRAPNHGGLWEAGVKAVKYHLRRVMGNLRFTCQSFLTTLNQIEGVLNPRPLYPLSCDPDDFDALTPGHFLVGRPITAIAEPSLTEVSDNSKYYEEEFVRAQLSVISEERVERETEEEIARQHAIQQLRWESELNELRLEIESIRSNVRRTSCAQDRKKTSSNYRISIGRAEEHVRETSPAVFMVEATRCSDRNRQHLVASTINTAGDVSLTCSSALSIPVTTPIEEEKGMDYLRVVHVKVKGEQGILNAVIDTGTCGNSRCCRRTKRR